MRRLFRFSLSSVFWLILLVAANLCWYVYKVQPVQRLQAQLRDEKAQRAYERKLAEELGKHVEMAFGELDAVSEPS